MTTTMARETCMSCGNNLNWKYRTHVSNTVGAARCCGQTYIVRSDERQLRGRRKKPSTILYGALSITLLLGLALFSPFLNE